MGNIAGLEVGLPTDPLNVEPSWFTTVLQTSGAIDGDTSVAAVSTEPFQVGVGLLGQLARVTLTYEGGSGPETLVLKYPIDVPHQRGMADGLNAYEREVRFYTELAPTSALRTPTVYASMISEDKSHCLIVMEDLSQYRQADRISGVTWDEAVAAVKVLARFHAQWDGSDQLEEMATCWFTIDNPVYSVILPQFIEAGWGPCQQHGAQFLDDEIVAFGNRWLEYLPLMQQQLMTSPTLSHADWRADNMFFDNEGVIAIDFQLLGIANPAYDLAYFICQSIERDVRAGRERELMEMYADELRAAGVPVDSERLWFDVRVAVGFCLIYGVVSYAQYELLPGEGQHVIDTLLRRSTQGITDLNAVEAVLSLTPNGA